MTTLGNAKMFSLKDKIEETEKLAKEKIIEEEKAKEAKEAELAVEVSNKPRKKKK